MFRNFHRRLGLYGETTKFGGAILNEDSLKMKRCAFTHNYARNGGAINNYFGKIRASIIAFSNNASWFAGAINNHEGAILISDSIFSDNYSDKKWDGFFDIFKLNAKDLDSYDIESDKSAGAIFNSNILNLKGCIFKNNIGFSGSVYNPEGAFLIINETLFSGDFDKEIRGHGELKSFDCEFMV